MTFHYTFCKEYSPPRAKVKNEWSHATSPLICFHGTYKDRLPLPAKYIIIINSVGIVLKVFSYESQDSLGPHHRFGNPEFYCLIGEQRKSVVKILII